MVSIADYGSAAHKASCAKLDKDGWTRLDSFPYAKKTVFVKFVDDIPVYQTVMPSGEIKSGYQVDK